MLFKQTLSSSKLNCDGITKFLRFRFVLSYCWSEQFSESEAVTVGEAEPLKPGDIEEADEGHDGEGEEDGGQMLQVIMELVNGTQEDEIYIL